jgi:cation transport ATPase
VVTVSRPRKPGSSAPVGISWSDGVVRLRDKELFGERLGELCVIFLRRVFALSEVKSVEIDGDESCAEIRFDVGRLKLTNCLERLAGVIRGQFPQDATAMSDSSVLGDLSYSSGRVRVLRLDTILTTWDIVDRQPGRIRLRHESIRGDAVLASRVQTIIKDLSGVIDCSVQTVTGSVLIRFDPTATSPLRLLRILERERRQPALPDLEIRCPRPDGFGLSNISLGLATAGEIAVPALLPVCAILLVGSNLGTFRAAGRQFLQGRLGLSALYASIVAATLASGQFIASAAMSWMFTFWRHRYCSQLMNARSKLLGQIIRQPSYVRLAAPESGAANVEIPTEDLKPSDVILITAGEQIPVDGRVKRGHGLVDERLVRAANGLNRKRPDDTVFAGSTLQFGELHVELLRQGSQTYAAALARATLAEPPLPSGSRVSIWRGEEFAEQTVMPTMALASLGFLIGGAGTAGAILRPDYATGLGLAFPLETLQAVALCLRHGFVIRDPDSIERLATTDLLIIESNSALERTELELDAIQPFPGIVEEDLLRFADAAFHHLDDERAVVLRSLCQERGITPLGVQPVEFATDITLMHGNDCIKVGDLGTRINQSSKPHDPRNPDLTKLEVADSLMVGINGRVAGLIHFRRSARLEAARTLQRLRSKRDVHIGIISSQSLSTLATLGASLEADFLLGDLTPDDRIRLLQNCRQRGFKVAYVGDCHVDPRIVAEAHVAISLAEYEIHGPDDDPAPIRLLHPRLSKLGELWEVASVHQRRLKIAHRYALIPNLLCIAGAFAWGFSSLASVAVTNLGTYGIYLRTATSIRSLEHQISQSLNLRPSLR